LRPPAQRHCECNKAKLDVRNDNVYPISVNLLTKNVYFK
jgi:hypothetical protein